MEWRSRAGFTLIEISIVLVIIGLIVGGILVGRDLVRAADIRAQVTQIEQLKSATMTFKGKYALLPGDISPTHVTQLGFAAAGGGTYCANGLTDNSRFENGFVDAPTDNQEKENLCFLAELAFAKLTTCENCAPNAYDMTNSTWDANFTRAKLGTGTINIWGGAPPGNQPSWSSYGANYIEVCNNRPTPTASTLTPSQVFAIDSKIDDGMPLSGSVVATSGNCNHSASGAWWEPHPPSQGAGGSSSAKCVSTSTTPNSYNTSNSTTLCGVRFDAGF